MNDLMTIDGVKTMDSREIAELMNKEHRNVLRDIDLMFDKLEGVCSDPSTPQEEEYHRGDRTQYKYLKSSTIDTFMAKAMGAEPVRLRDKFASSYRNEQNNQEYRCYRLPYRETMILVSGYSVALRARVIDRWLELERAAAPSIPKTYAEALQLAADQAKELEAKTAALAIAAPKAELADRLTSSEDAIDIGTVSRVLALPYGRNTLFSILRGKKILMADNRPYQEYMDRGYFRVIEEAFEINGKTKVNFKTLVYQKGIAYLSKILVEE